MTLWGGLNVRVSWFIPQHKFTFYRTLKTSFVHLYILFKRVLINLFFLQPALCLRYFTRWMPDSSWSETLPFGFVLQQLFCIRTGFILLGFFFFPFENLCNKVRTNAVDGKCSNCSSGCTCTVWTCWHEIALVALGCHWRITQRMPLSEGNNITKYSLASFKIFAVPTKSSNWWTSVFEGTNTSNFRNNISNSDSYSRCDRQR